MIYGNYALNNLSKVVARPALLYCNASWVTMTRDMTRPEAAEMRFRRSVKGYTRLDKIRSEVIRKELEISVIQDVRSKHKQNWINHIERMDNTRLPKHALNYKPRGEEIVDAPGNDGNASMPEQVKRPNPWKMKMMVMMIMMMMMMNNLSPINKSRSTELFPGTCP